MQWCLRSIVSGALTMGGLVGLARLSQTPSKVAAASPRALTLHLSDLAPGYTVKRQGPRTDAALAPSWHLSRRSVAAHGRITGWDVIYNRNALTGILQLENIVSVYRDAGGAAWGYGEDVASGRRATFQRHHYKAMSFPRIGSQSVALTITAKSGGFTYEYDDVTWRHGRYTASVAVAGVRGLMEISRLIHYARLDDARIGKYG